MKIARFPLLEFFWWHLGPLAPLSVGSGACIGGLVCKVLTLWFFSRPTENIRVLIEELRLLLHSTDVRLRGDRVHTA